MSASAHRGHLAAALIVVGVVVCVFAVAQRFVAVVALFAGEVLLFAGCALAVSRDLLGDPPDEER